ncbi:hypothetical protein ES703_120755 [subsurface metagenome]
MTLNDITSVKYWYHPAEHTVDCTSSPANYMKPGSTTGDAYPASYIVFGLDTDDNGANDVWVVQYEAFDTDLSWQQDEITDTAGTFHAVDGSDFGTLADVKAFPDATCGTLGEATLTSVRANTGGWGLAAWPNYLANPLVTYVDDIEINTTNYAMEPLETAATTGGEVAFGPDITVNSYTVDSASQITASITIPADAVTGARNVAVHLLSAGTGTGIGVFTVNLVPYLTVTAPSAIDLGLMKKDADNPGIATPGSVDTNAPSWSVTAKDVKAENTGQMVTAGPTPLAALFQISNDGLEWVDAAPVGITYNQDGGISLPFYVSQYVANSDAAGSYKITITFTSTY